MNHKLCSRCSPWPVVALFAVSTVVLSSFAGSFLYQGNCSSSTEVEFEESVRAPLTGPEYPPIFAYWITGTRGEHLRILRLLKAVYHPRNQYLLQLDAGSTTYERVRLAYLVRSERVFRAFGNVHVMGRAYPIDRTGPSSVSAMLHAAAVLLKIGAAWDWFIKLSTSDYPLVTQDDLLHVFSSLPRDLNFIEHAMNPENKMNQNIQNVIVDPSLYENKRSQLFYSSELRTAPDAFEIFTGSPWMILSRSLMEHCVFSWDNLPRKLLLYFTNVIHPMESYFQTVVLNSLRFRNTTINNNLWYTLGERPSAAEPISLNQSHYAAMINSGSAFGTWFRENDALLQKIDEDVLERPSSGVVPGKWCAGFADDQKTEDSNDRCSSWSDIDTVERGPSGEKLENFVSELISENI
ncbi:Beta-glucuronosyltransferase GlcAT14A, partial [Ananas comosus]